MGKAERDAVVVVDDSPDHRAVETVMLEHAGYDVRAVSSVWEARALIARRHPTLIMLDVGMPDTDGISFTRELRSDPGNDDIAIVVYTAYGPAMGQDALAAGCDAYLTKPTPLKDLLRVIDRCIKGRHPRR